MTDDRCQVSTTKEKEDIQQRTQDKRQKTENRGRKTDVRESI